MKYLIVIEPASTGFSAYSPDLPGCVSTGLTRQECESNMREAIEFHREGCVRKANPSPSRQRLPRLLRWHDQTVFAIGRD